MLIFGQVMGQNGPQNINYSIYGHMLLGHNSVIICSIGLKFFLVTQETIIYRLVMRNYDADAFLENHIFGGKMGVATTVAPKGLGPQVPTRKLAHWVEHLGQPLSLKLVFKKFGYEPPPF